MQAVQHSEANHMQAGVSKRMLLHLDTSVWLTRTDAPCFDKQTTKCFFLGVLLDNSSVDIRVFAVIVPLPACTPRFSCDPHSLAAIRLSQAVQHNRRALACV